MSIYVVYKLYIQTFNGKIMLHIIVGGLNCVKPRIFISSTFYDLKYIREELSNYIKVHDFEPIMFEDGDIGYTPGKKLDESCYDAMRSADMVILIVGGEYGSAASEENEKDFDEYVSITRKEFRTAVEAGIPIFCMIDANVNTEYGVYDINVEDIEDEKCKIKFKATKSINVFRFIREIRTLGSIPIQEFKNVSEIKDFLGKQWADMFKSYLNILKSETENKKIENTVTEMKYLIQKMDIMLDTVGKNILQKNSPKDYENVINQQDISVLSREIIDAFRIVLLKPDTCKEMDVRKKLVNDFLQRLVKLFKENKWVMFDSDNQEDVDKFFELLETEQYYVDTITTDFSHKIKNKIKLLYDDSNIKKIQCIICEDENFKKMFDI